MELFGEAQAFLSARQARVWLVLCLGRIFSRNLLCEIGEYLGSPLLPCFRGQLLHLIDIETRKISTCRLSTHFAHNSYYCLVSPQQLLCFPYDSSQIRSLDIPTLAVSSFPNMGISRSDPGAVVFEACIYVFGGDWGKSNEYYDYRLGRWISLAHSHYAYFMLSPCVYLAQIYLPQPDVAKGQMDVFSPLYGTFKLVPAPKRDLSRSVAFVEDTGIVWLTAQGDVVKQGFDVIKVQITRGAFDGSIVPGNSAPVRFGFRVYWTTPYGDQIYAFDLKKSVVDMLQLTT